jgi:hypothetical protein
VLAAALVPAAAAAGTGPPTGKHLELSVVSSRPELVSGGDARVEVAVPDKIALGAVTVELKGADVTAAFGPDPEGNHQLEGVVTGLPEGPSTLVASVGKGTSRQEHYEMELVNHSIDGPMFSGPRQDPFFCSTAAHRAKVGLGAVTPALGTCQTGMVVRYVYRSTGGTWQPYTPGAPRPADLATTTLMNGQTVDFVVRWETGTIDRFLYSIAILDPQTNWNGRLIYKFQGGVAMPLPGRPDHDRQRGPLPAGPHEGLRDRVLHGNEDRHPLQPAARRRDRDHGQGPVRVRLRRAAVHRGRGRLWRRDPAVRLRPEPPGPDRRGHPAVLVSGHGHADHPHRRLRAARALG